MEAEKAWDLLRRATVLYRLPWEVNIFSIGARGYYEEATSDLLAFFLNPTAEHGLGDLLLSCLVELLPESPAILELEEPPRREYTTQRRNQIDILLNGPGWVMVIENKIWHRAANPFAEYRQTVEARFPGKNHYFLILAPTDPQIPTWKWISYKSLIVKARDRLGVWFVGFGISKWPLLLREFLMHVEGELYSSMDNQQFGFVRDNYSEIQKLIEMRELYIRSLKERITGVGQEILGSAPGRVSKQLFENFGIALRLYPKEDRAYNSTFVVRDDGGFRIQLYVDKALPGGDQAAFADKFSFMGDDGEASIFYKDEVNLERALEAFRLSLSLLRRNTM